jgi:hypothetical protein
MRRSPILFLTIAGTIVLVFGVGWYTRVGSVPQPTITPTPTQEPTHTQSWGERFRNPALPSIPGATWQTYTDTKYGFTFQYATGWEIQKSTVSASNGIVLAFCVQAYKPKECRVLTLNIHPGNIRDELIATDGQWAADIQKNGLIPTARVNGIDLFITDADRGSSEEMLLDLHFEHNGWVYSFGSTFAGDQQVQIINEYIIKSFHFSAQ